MEKLAGNKGRRRRAAAAAAAVVASKDRISKLPDPILHHILCFLDQRTAAKTSVLSKPWRYLWCTRPQIDFRHGITVVAGRSKESFFSVLDRTLRGYSDRELHLQEFTLHWPASLCGERLSFLIRKWIPILVQNMGVNKFHLHFTSTYYSSIPKTPLALSIFRSESLRDLYLKRCVLESIPADQPPLHLKHLQKLSLDSVEIPEEILDHILSNCLFLEYVFLRECTGFKSIQLKHLANLKVFYFYDYERRHVNISLGDGNIPTLRVFKIDEYCLLNCNTQFYFSQLTHLSMTNVTLSSSDFFSCSNILPCLEELKLHYCSGIKEFNLSSRSMKLLEITNTKCRFKVTANAPSIVSFCYQDFHPQSISFSTPATSYIRLTRYLTESSLRLQGLIGLLKGLSQSEITIKLEKTTVPWLGNQVDKNTNVGVDLPVVVDHLIVAEPTHADCAVDFLDSLFLVLRPRIIYMNYIQALANNPRVTEINLKQRDMVPQLFPKGVTTQVFYWGRYWSPFEPEILSKLISKKGQSMDQLCPPTEWERRIKLIIFDLDQASNCYRKFIRIYLALC